MSSDDAGTSDTSKSPRLRFSLLTLFIGMTAACLYLAWWVQPNRFTVEAVFYVAAVPPSLTSDENSAFDPQEYQLLQKTHRDLITSNYVLEFALRSKKIATLPLILSKTDPIKWLQANLEIDSEPESELLTIRNALYRG